MPSRRSSRTGVAMKSVRRRTGLNISIGLELTTEAGIPGAITQVQSNDVIVEEETTSGLIKKAKLLGADANFVQHENYYLQSSNPKVATLDSSGHLTRVSDGLVRIIARPKSGRGPVFVSSVVRIEMTGGGVARTYLKRVLGTLAEKANSDLLAVSQEPAIIEMYSSGNTRNPNCWTTASNFVTLDTSCLSRARPTSTLIAPDLCIQAEHYKTGSATFVAMDGEVATRSVVSRVHMEGIPGETLGARDISICRLNEALPSKFKPVLMPGPDFWDHFGLEGLPILVMANDQQRKALITGLSPTAGNTKEPLLRHYLSTQNPELANFHEPLVSGDSGSPLFLLIEETNGTYSHRPVLLQTAYGASVGPSIPTKYQQIRDGITAIGGDPDTLEYADLSAYSRKVNGVWFDTPSTDLLANREDFNATSWVKQGFTDQGIGPGPDGNDTAQVFTPTTNGYLFQDVASSGSARILRTSVWLKSSSTTNGTLGMRLPNGGTNPTSNVSISPSTSWQKFVVEATLPANTAGRFLLDTRAGTGWSDGELSVYAPSIVEITP